MKTIRDQIGNRCIHFTGIGNETCNAGIKYEQVRLPDVKPYKFPCLKNSLMSGGSCESSHFPTDEEISEEIKKIESEVQASMNAYSDIKLHIQMTGELQGSIPCPACGNKLRYTAASTNGHIWAKCRCGISIME